MYSSIPTTKTGICCECGAEGNVVKVAKSTYCVNCRNRQKALIQMEKSKNREANRKEVKKIGTKLRGETNGRESEIQQSKNNLVQDLDRTFSRYIRILYSQPDGNCKCYTCTSVKNFGLLQLGHFIGRSHMGLRWDTRNGKPQCVGCNIEKHGNLEVYREELEKEQAGLPQQLLEQSHQVEKPELEEMKMLLIELRAKLKVVEQKMIK